jgi:hypothetical protein
MFQGTFLMPYPSSERTLPCDDPCRIDRHLAAEEAGWEGTVAGKPTFQQSGPGEAVGVAGRLA